MAARDLSYELMVALRNSSIYWMTPAYLSKKFKVRSARVMNELNDLVEGGSVVIQQLAEPWVRITERGLKLLKEYEKQKGK